MVSRKRKLLVWWHRSGIGVRLVLFALVSFLLFALVYWQRPLSEATYLPSNIAVFSLVNLNVAVLCILIFLVGRNLFQILFESKRQILGSRLRLRLVTAIVGLTAVPAVLLIMVSSGLLSRAIDGWFSSPAETSVEAAKEVAKIYFTSLKDRSELLAKGISEELQSRQLDLQRVQDLKGLLEQRRVSEGLYAVELYDRGLNPLVSVENATAAINYFSPPEPSEMALQQALGGESQVAVEQTSSSQFIRAFQPLPLNGEALALVVTLRVPSEMSLAMDTIRESYQEYLQLKHFKNPLRSTYILTLYMLAALVIFAAMWLGIHIAKQLTVPIQRLSEAMREVAKGNFGRQVHHHGDDEIAFLTKSFNQMTTQLRDSTTQAERRRIYLETVLANLAVGVVVVDAEAKVRGVNDAVLRILGKSESSETYEGSLVETFVPAQIWSEVKSLVLLQEEEEEEKSDKPHSEKPQSEKPHSEKPHSEKEVLFSLDGREKRVLCTTGVLQTREGQSLGSVLVIDDVTALSEAQRLAAWREAARRIAHEIKNPLTPIKLAAQRLTRAFQVEQEYGKLVHDASNTIVEHVDSIKRLADEFSRFARMPTLQLEPTDLKPIVHEVVLSYVENEEGISFQSIIDDEIPKAQVDPDQIRRLLINLIENATKALHEEQMSLFKKSNNPKVIVKLYFEKIRAQIVLEVCDNGPGIPEEERNKVLEPYYTKRTGGTGLGLAIVSSIVSEHNGEVRIVDYYPRGTRVIVSLPIEVTESTQRKLDFAVG